MILGFPQGFSPSDTFDVPEKVEAWFQATDAFSVGQLAMIDIGAGTSNGKKVLKATNANDHNVVGLYEGKGFPTGSATTVSGLTGRDCVAGDVIRLLVYGPGVGRLSDTVTAVAGIPCGATVGDLLAVAAAAGCGNLGVTLIGTATGATITATATATTTATARCWVKLL